MCGRFASFQPPQAIQTLFKTVNPLVNAPPSWNIAPSHEVMAVRHHQESRENRLDLLTWGLIPHWTKKLSDATRPINARAETVATSRFFASAFARRRCLIPADAWYEWQAQDGVKMPYAMARPDRSLMAFAGVWESWTSPAESILRTFAIVTCRAEGPAAAIHDRMPVIVAREDWPVWLGRDAGDPLRLLAPAEPDQLEVWRVGREVGKVANNRPEVLAPIGHRQE